MTESGAYPSESGSNGFMVLWIVPVILIADQVSKYIAVRTLDGVTEPVGVVGHFFRLTLTYNRGAAFGLNLGSPLIHTVVSIVALALLVYLFWTLPAGARLLRGALAMVLGGALGNIVDRIRLDEGVVDFLDFGINLEWRWPVFNVADSFVTVGIILLAIGYSRQGAPTGDEGADQADAESQPNPSA